MATIDPAHAANLSKGKRVGAEGEVQVEAFNPTFYSGEFIIHSTIAFKSISILGSYVGTDGRSQSHASPTQPWAERKPQVVGGPHSAGQREVQSDDGNGGRSNTTINSAV